MRVQKVESRVEPVLEAVVGTVRAKLRATLESKVSGRIETITVVLGDKVKAGQLLVRLHAAEIHARLDQARASLEQAEREWKRVSTLFEQQAATRSEHDAAESRYHVALATVAEAKAMQSYVEIVAPFDGIVSRKWVDPGDLAMPGEPLVELEDPSALQLDVDVAQAVASRVKDGARLAVRVDTLPTEFAGVVREIAPAVDPVSRTLRVKLDLADAALLRSGQFARLILPVGERPSLRIPGSALIERGQMEVVFVALDRRAELRLVRTGRRLGDELEVLAGLDSGDVVVVEGADLLVDGQSISLK